MKKLFLVLIGILIGQISFCQSDRDFLVVSTFWQGGANNCASVALIKAAMLKFGYRDMFTLERTGNNYNIVLKDGAKLTISETERLLAKNKYAKFKTEEISSLGTERDTVLFYAYLAYAAIAKNIVRNGYWGCVEQGSRHLTDYTNYEDALKFISRTSFCTDYCYRLLGFKSKENKIFDFKKPEDINQRGVILYSWPHAVVAYNNRIDCHGTWMPVTTHEMCNNKFEWYILLE